MKLKASMRDMKNSNNIVLGVGYCCMQRTLAYEAPIAYAANVNGWACDLYKLNGRYSIATGYNYSRASNTDLYNKTNKDLRAELDQLENDCQGMGRDERLQALIAILDKYL